MLIGLPSIFSRFIFISVLNTNPADAMKRRHETVRLSNLELLVAEAGSAAALARLAHTSESYLSQIRNQLTTAKGTPRGVGDDLAAKLERGFHHARQDLAPAKAFVVYSGEERYPVADGVEAISVREMATVLASL